MWPALFFISEQFLRAALRRLIKEDLYLFAWQTGRKHVCCVQHWLEIQRLICQGRLRDARPAAHKNTAASDDRILNSELSWLRLGG